MMTFLIATTIIIAVIIATAVIYCRLVELPHKNRKEAELRRADLLLYLFKNRHIDILKMPAEEIIATAKKLDDYISGKE